ncbi:hypothetical protein Hanom_Chr09g00796851 [Helianthus anomalus]
MCRLSWRRIRIFLYSGQFRVWVEEELVVWVPDCLGRQSELTSDSESSLKSSPVAMQSGVGAEEDEGLTKGNPILEEGRRGGSVSSTDGADRRSDDGPSAARLSRPEGETSSKVVGKGNDSIFFFRSGRKSKHRRKVIRRSHLSTVGNEGGDFSGSSGSIRPSKRNKAQVDDSDPFSLNRLLDQEVEAAQVIEARANKDVQEASLASNSARDNQASDNRGFIDLNSSASVESGSTTIVPEQVAATPLEGGNSDPDKGIDKEYKAVIIW